ncbi:hypothetical protein LG288_05195 [Idiomarina seosinensis]|uniref:hypothetical protein n=1 Tax=Idiomarina seosinensis TaxID=281739 RepID=UPI00385042E6
MLLIRFLALGLLLLMLTACEEPDRGFGDGQAEDRPEIQVILDFYQSIYEADDLDRAKQYASERMGGLMEHYGTSQGVQKYVLNRRYDDVQVQVESDSLVPYLNQADELRATVIFEGSYGDDEIKDSRDVVVVRQGDSWRVDRILDPRFRP